jgi:DNA-binding MarR family transcriptional regulator
MDKELKIINEISKDKSLTQRDLADRTSLSLGAVNLILKRLVKRGFIKTRALNPKKIEYIITPKGFTEKTNKTYNYFKKTIDLVKLVREEIAKIILDEYNRGQKKFVVLGSDDLADLIELALKGFDYQRVVELKEIKDNTALVLLSSSCQNQKDLRFINVKDRLGELYWGVD